MTQEYSFLCHVSCNMSHFPCYTLPTVSYPTPLKTLSRRTVDERVFYTVTAVWYTGDTENWTHSHWLSPDYHHPFGSSVIFIVATQKGIKWTVYPHCSQWQLTLPLRQGYLLTYRPAAAAASCPIINAEKEDLIYFRQKWLT